MLVVPVLMGRHFLELNFNSIKLLAGMIEECLCYLRIIVCSRETLDHHVYILQLEGVDKIFLVEYQVRHHCFLFKVKVTGVPAGGHRTEYLEVSSKAFSCLNDLRANMAVNGAQVHTCVIE